MRKRNVGVRFKEDSQDGERGPAGGLIVRAGGLAKRSTFSASMRAARKLLWNDIPDCPSAMAWW